MVNFCFIFPDLCQALFSFHSRAVPLIWPLLITMPSKVQIIRNFLTENLLFLWNSYLSFCSRFEQVQTIWSLSASDPIYAMFSIMSFSNNTFPRPVCNESPVTPTSWLQHQWTATNINKRDVLNTQIMREPLRVTLNTSQANKINMLIFSMVCKTTRLDFKNRTINFRHLHKWRWFRGYEKQAVLDIGSIL